MVSDSQSHCNVGLYDEGFIHEAWARKHKAGWEEGITFQGLSWWPMGVGFMFYRFRNLPKQNLAGNYAQEGWRAFQIQTEHLIFSSHMATHNAKYTHITSKVSNVLTVPTLLKKFKSLLRLKANSQLHKPVKQTNKIYVVPIYSGIDRGNIPSQKGEARR